MARRWAKFFLAGALGASVVVLPAVAGSETIPSINAYSYSAGGGEPIRYWLPETATVGEGGVVKISNASSETKHGLEFTGGTAGVKPLCTGITAAAAEKTGDVDWHAECTFSKAGTYTFICTVHPTTMRGTITVNAAGTTTSTGSTSTGTTTAPGTTSSSTSTPPPAGPLPNGSTQGLGSAIVGSIRQAVKLTAAPHGPTVSGSVDVSSSGAGGRLEVDLMAASSALAGRSPSVRIGRFVRSGVQSGLVHFTVPLSARARRTLHSRHHLAVLALLRLTPKTGQPVHLTRALTLHR